MTAVQLTLEQEELIRKIASRNGFVDYELKTVQGSATGENFLGVIKSVTIEDAEKKLELILKAAQVGQLRNQMPIRRTYLREIFVYERVFAKFEEFQLEFGIPDPFRSYPRIYATSDADCNECLVMENLRDKGYRLCDRKEPMDPEHISMVFKEYAKLHAISLAMKEKKPGDFRELAEGMEGVIWESSREQVVEYVTSMMANIKSIFEDDPSTIEVLEAFEERLPDLCLDFVKHPDNIVIEHGDCWCNNLMFVYENQDKPTAPSDVRIIDWQISKLSSPAMDLSYFFLVHSSKDILYDYERYLKIYHDALSKNLQEFSCDPETVFPYRVLLEHWKKRACMGVYMAFTVLKVMLCDPEEAPEASEDGKNLMDILNYVPEDDSEYSRRVRDLVEFSVEKGLL